MPVVAVVVLARRGVAFVGMLLLYSMDTVHPSGQYVVRQPLALHYAVEVRKLFQTTMGPAPSNFGHLLEMAFGHALLSALAGDLAVGVRRLFGRPIAPPG